MTNAWQGRKYYMTFHRCCCIGYLLHTQSCPSFQDICTLLRMDCTRFQFLRYCKCPRYMLHTRPQSNDSRQGRKCTSNRRYCRRNAMMMCHHNCRSLSTAPQRPWPSQGRQRWQRRQRKSVNGGWSAFGQRQQRGEQSALASELQLHQKPACLLDSDGCTK